MFVQPDVTVIYPLVEMLLNEVIKMQNITHAFYTCFFLNNIDEPIQKCSLPDYFIYVFITITGRMFLAVDY
jgi:hypothetical protein